MKKLLIILAIAISLPLQTEAGFFDWVKSIFGGAPTVILGAPTNSVRLERSINPETDSLYELGTTSREWLNIFTDNLTVTGLGGSGTRCVQVDTNGKLAKASAACGSGGGGSGGGTWSTTTSSHAGRLLNYPNNDTDIVTIGDTSTTSAEFFFDPNTTFAKFGANVLVTGSTTLQNFTYRLATGTAATTTNLAISGVTSNILKTNSTGGVVPAVSGTDYSNFGSTVGPTELQSTDFGDWTCNGTTCTLDATYLTANQTITLSGDASGSGTTGITVTVADDSHAHTGSTISGLDISDDTNLTAGTGITLTGDDLSIDTSQNIATLSNLTSNGFVKTSGGNGTLSVDTTTYESGLTAGDGLTRTVNDFDCDTASGSVFGCLASADWTTFNNKQASGNYITALTGDVTATGPGSVAATLATVNSNVGSFTNANVTVNAKGLVTAVSNGTGGSGTGNVATSSAETAGQLPYWTSTNGTPATLGGVATTSVTCSGDASCTPFTVIGPSPIVISSTGGAGGTWATTSEQYFWSQFRDLQVAGSPTYLTPTSTTRGFLVGSLATSTLFNTQIVNGTTTNATSTNVSISGTLDIDQMTSAILLTGATGIVAEYAGTSCTNQFPRSLNALGVATCASVANTDLTNSTISGISLGSNLADLTAGAGLSSGGTYNGGTARTFTVDGSSIFRDWSIQGNGYLAPTTTRGILVTASSTISNLQVVNGTTTNATSTNLSISGTLDIDQMTSALLLTGSTGIVAEYAGASCTNQFPRSQNALGAWTCATVANTDLANSTISGVSLGGTLANLTATDSTLTFSGTYTGATARTIGLNLGNTNTWTVLQTFQAGLLSQASSTITSLTVVNGTTTNATTTNLTITSLSDGCLNATSGKVGSTGVACGSGGGSWATTSEQYYWSQFRDWSVNAAGNLVPTTTRGILVTASSTIGNATTAGGLTVSGGATTTGSTTLASLGGNVGIGVIPNTASKLSVGFGSGQNINFKDTLAANNNTGIYFDSGTTQNASIRLNLTGEMRIGGEAAGFFPTFYYSGIEGARIDTSGRFGIATTSPFRTLSVGGGAYIGGNLTATGTIQFTNISGSTQCLQVDTNGTVTGTGSACGAGGGGSSNSKWATSTNATYIQPNGGTDMGILLGTTTPNPFADFIISSSTGAIMSFTDTNAPTDRKHILIGNYDGRLMFGTSTDALTSTSTGLIYDPVGSAAIGVASSTPTYALSLGTGNGSSTSAILVAEHRPATSTSMTVDWRNGNTQNVRIGNAAMTISFSNQTDGATLKLLTCNPPTGTAGTVTWGTEILWAGGSAPTQTTTANKCDVWSFLGTQGTSTLRVFGSVTSNF